MKLKAKNKLTSKHFNGKTQVKMLIQILSIFLKYTSPQLSKNKIMGENDLFKNKPICPKNFVPNKILTFYSQ